MQIVNDYNRDVYNGEIGRVFSIAEEGNLVQVRKIFCMCFSFF
jgi:ATP-dependent exoDNAse (exonuclease V) alpha subunit